MRSSIFPDDKKQCEKATFILDHRQLERFSYDSSKWVNAQEGEGEKVPMLDRDKWSDAWMVEKFVHWLDGGEPMETNLEGNLQSVALIYASIESSRTGKPVKVQEFLSEALAEV